MSIKKTAVKKVSKKTPAVRKIAARKPTTKKAIARKTSAKKATKKKPTAKKTVAKKPVTKRVAASKTPAKKTSKKKPAAKKTAGKKPVATKAAARKPRARKKRQVYWLTQESMARSCNITRQTFSRWNVPQVAKIGRYVFYTAADVLDTRLAHHEALLKKATSIANQNLSRTEREEKLRLVTAQAEGQEIKNAQLREELAPVDLLRWVLGKVGGQVSAIFDALPMHLKNRNPKLTASNIEMIQRDVAKVQNLAAQMTVDLDEYYQRNPTADR